MTPIPPRPEKEANPAQKTLEDRLRYYEDLGIRSFYRDRAPSTAKTLMAKIVTPQKKTVPPPAAAVPAPATLSRQPALAAACVPLAETAAKKGRQGIVQGPSLFEAAGRVEGDTLERISADLGECTRCKLHKGRNKIVFGVGNPHAELVFVGEGPGHDEDMKGE